MTTKKLLRRPASSNSMPSFPPLLSRIFAGRGVSHPDELDHSLAGLLPPDRLHGIKAAAEIVCAAITGNKKILILGDFDADGATSCALLVSGFAMLGARQVEYLVPDRFRYGYGLTPEIVDVAAASAPDLLITVDNGISSVEGVAHANALGIEVIITDHHLPGSALPDAAAIVNPNQPACQFPSKCLAGVGVAFYLLSAVRAGLREAGWFRQGDQPGLANLLDLVALGTVADMVPLDKNNRILVAEGIKRIRRGRGRPGIRALLEVARVDFRHVCSRDLGFSIAPRLNAAGRLEDMAIGIQCLLATEQTAGKLATRLDQLNQERKRIGSEMQQQAESHVAQLALDKLHHVGLTLYHEDWHQGIVGIVAARIKERSYRPVVAFAKGTGDELKGSARSIQGFHIRDAFDAIATRNPGLLLKFGGHAMAAGLSLKLARLEQFREEFDREARNALDASLLENTLWSDGEIDAPITLQLATEIANAAPWGQGFPEPVFDGAFSVHEQKIVGGKHLKLTLQPETNTHPDPAHIDAIYFNHPNLLESHQLQCAYRLNINHYRGRQTPQLIIEAVFPA